MEESSQNSDGDESGRSSDVERNQISDEEERSPNYYYEPYNSEDRSNGFNPDRSWNKRRKNEKTLKQDRISVMPDTILLHILYFLRTKDAVKTGILSKRWLYLWTSVPNLDFTGPRYRDLSSFVDYVDQTLILHKCCKVKKFVVDCGYNESLASRVDLWLRFATRANVEELCLNLEKQEDFTDDDNYKLPQHLYTNSLIMKLSLFYCDVVPKGLIDWKSLKSLSIRYSNMSEYLIKKILVGSPVLGFLELYGFCGLNRLDIDSKSLRKLVVRDHEMEGGGSTLEISAPKLHSLAILGTMYAKKFKLINMQSLVDCKLNLSQYRYSLVSDADYEVHENELRELLQRLCNVEKLTLGNWCIQVLATLVGKVTSFPVSRRRCLILDTRIEKCDIPGIAGLLQSSPGLETLVIDMTFSYDYQYWFNKKEPKYYWTSQEWSSKCAPLGLKTVEIISCTAEDLRSEHIIQFVQFLLNRSILLEKMVIKVQEVDHTESFQKELLQVAQRLLKLPRSSHRAEVIFAE